jgi:hypothetical protein
MPRKRTPAVKVGFAIPLFADVVDRGADAAPSDAAVAGTDREWIPL